MNNLHCIPVVICVLLSVVFLEPYLQSALLSNRVNFLQNPLKIPQNFIIQPCNIRV